MHTYIASDIQGRKPHQLSTCAGKALDGSANVHPHNDIITGYVLAGCMCFLAARRVSSVKTHSPVSRVSSMPTRGKSSGVLRSLC
mmetsp:Transcript_10362/g.26295  ORF Transcript_10362/g.26295 Transcript_10362/m.26295 type:complete len:85 (+) Transcript_10362:186-440(+)